jgi:ATP-dependent Clp protease ATP-binding subunit ClpA
MTRNLGEFLEMATSIWQKNLRDAILLDPLIILHGNVKDLFRVDSSKQAALPTELAGINYVPFSTWLALELQAMQFPVIAIYDAVDGAVVLRHEMVAKFIQAATSRSRNQGRKQNPSETFSAKTGTENQAENPTQASSLALPTSDQPTEVASSDWMVNIGVPQSPEVFFQTLYGSVFRQSDTPVAVICRFTDRYLSFTDRQDANEKRLSILIQKAAMEIQQKTHPNQIQSRIFLLFDLEGSVPQEISLQAPFSTMVRIPMPALEDRELFFKDNHRQFYSAPHQRFDPVSEPQILRELANLSDGLFLQDLLSLIALSNEEQLGLGQNEFKNLLDRFRFGTQENAWKKITDDTLRNAKKQLQERVKGQDQIIDEVVPTLVRAKLGLTEISNKTHSTKPRGVFFFVGPTGVGKTELSKAIAELIFGDEKAMIRFDMSEYSEEHQQARLIGAPPGYVGFDQGGQLPNAIMEKPFSVVLFDEIEKAHPRILDKFLQILDDGRLTDGMGRTVYFSEAIIIFTSNIGTAPRIQSNIADSALSLREPYAFQSIQDIYSQLGNLPYEKLTEHFRAKVKEFFVNRPEILNRIGEDNILVFNFLKDESAKNEIVRKQVYDLSNYLTEKFQVSVELTPAFCKVLLLHPSGFERNGARGVRNLMNKLVLDRVAMEIFSNPDSVRGQKLVVDYAAKLDTLVEGFSFDKGKVKHIWN